MVHRKGECGCRTYDRLTGEAASGANPDIQSFFPTKVSEDLNSCPVVDVLRVLRWDRWSSILA